MGHRLPGRHALGVNLTDRAVHVAPDKPATPVCSGSRTGCQASLHRPLPLPDRAGKTLEIRRRRERPTPWPPPTKNQERQARFLRSAIDHGMSAGAIVATCSVCVRGVHHHGAAIRRTERLSTGPPLRPSCSQGRSARRSRAGSCRNSSPVSRSPADSTCRQISVSFSSAGMR